MWRSLAFEDPQLMITLSPNILCNGASYRRKDIYAYGTKNIGVNIWDVHEGRKEKPFLLGNLYAFVCIVKDTKGEGGKLKSYWPCTHTCFVAVSIVWVCVSTQFKPEANGRCLFLCTLCFVGTMWKEVKS